MCPYNSESKKDYWEMNKKVDIDFDKLSDFLISIREVLDGLDEDKIEEIAMIKEFI